VEIDQDGNIDVVSLGENYYGTAELEILASDEEDEASGFLKIVVEPVNDNPVVSFTEPRHDSLVSGVIAIRGNANDIERTLATVELRVDNDEWFPVDGLTVWSHHLNTTFYENGPHTIEARSYDGELYSQVASVGVQVQNEPQEPPAPPIPPPPPGLTIEITYPVEGEEVSGGTMVGITTTFTVPLANVTIRMGTEEPWIETRLSMPEAEFDGEQDWTYLLNTEQYPDGSLTIYCRASVGGSFSDITTRNVVVNNTEIEIPPEKDSDSDAFPWWIVILIIAIAIVALVALIFMKKKSDREKEEEEEAARAAIRPVQGAAPTLKLASPATPAFGTPPTQTPAYASQTPQAYGGAGQAGFALAQSPYQQPQGTPQLPPTGGTDQSLYLTAGTMQGYGAQQYPQSGTSPYQEQPKTPLLPPSQEVAATGSTVACFSCGSSVPVPAGASIITCPQCGTMGQL